MRDKKRKVLLLKPFQGKVFLKNRVFSMNNGHNIFLGLKEFLSRNSIEINTIDLGGDKQVDKYIYCDVPYPWSFQVWARLLANRSKNILFCFESPVVNPFSHMRFLYFLFKTVYTWDDNLAKDGNCIKFYIPQTSLNFNTRPKKFREKAFLVLINANKSSSSLLRLLSPYKKDLYRERVRAINYFEENAPTKLSLYGYGWNRPKLYSIREKIFGYKKHSTYKGEIDEGKKISILSGFKFCLCFENASADGYITEKIFDCFKARCVPIYWGAPNIERYIKKGCFIDFRDFMDYEKLLSFLETMSEKRYNTYIKNIENFINNPDVKDIWFEKGFEKALIEAVLN